MAKDPAFLFYPADFLVGVMDMTDEEVGVYIRLLCRQHQKGHIPESVIRRSPETVQEKFLTDNSGKYYNERLEEEIKKRRKYVAQRLANLKGNHTESHMDNHKEDHMDSHTINENENRNKDVNLNEIERMNKDYKERLKRNPNVNQEFLKSIGGKS